MVCWISNKMKGLKCQSLHYLAWKLFLWFTYIYNFCIHTGFQNNFGLNSHSTKDKKFSFFEFIFVTQVYNEKRFYIITQSFSESKSSLFERGLKLFLGLYCWKLILKGIVKLKLKINSSFKSNRKGSLQKTKGLRPRI